MRPPLLRAAATILLAGALVGACSAPLPPSLAPPPDAARSPEASASAASGPVPLQAHAADVSLTVGLDRAVVEPGGTLAIVLTVANGRTTPLELLPPCDGAAVVRAAVPSVPDGLDWPELPGAFKTYVLEQGLAPGGVPAFEPLDLPARGRSCEATAVLAPGDTYEARLTWNAEYVADVPLIPDDYPLTVTLGYDPVRGGGLTRVEQLVLDTTITVAGDGPTLLTAGQAIDVVLADPRFAAWLQRQPMASWANANIFLEGGVGQGIVPPVAHWDIELFREPRNWAIAYVDPIGGGLISIHYCDQPCDR